MRIVPTMQHLFPRICGVVLREFENHDVGTLAEIEYDSKVKKYSKVPEYSKEIWISRFAKDIGSHDYLAVIAQPEGLLAGRASISRVEWARDGSPILDGPWSHELTIFISPNFWGRGFGRIVAQELVSLAFESFGAVRIEATVHPENASALSLLQNLGFLQSGIGGRNNWQHDHLFFTLEKPA